MPMSTWTASWGLLQRHEICRTLLKVKNSISVTFVRRTVSRVLSIVLNVTDVYLRLIIIANGWTIVLVGQTTNFLLCYFASQF
jgi:hypothetical protein